MISISRFIPLVHLEYQKPSTVVKVANLDNVDIYLVLTEIPCYKTADCSKGC